MDYDVILKAIGEATDLRRLIDGIETQVADKEAQIQANLKEIEKRKTLEKVTETLVTAKDGQAKELEKHRAELNKRLKKLEDAKVALPFDEKPKPIVTT